MKWSYEGALKNIGKQFPGFEVSVADGGDGYVVGVVEDNEEAIVASFRLTFDLNSEQPYSIEQIDIAGPGVYCGIVTAGESKRGPSDENDGATQTFARLNVGSRFEKPYQGIRGFVGDHEVVFPLAAVEVQERQDGT